MTFFGCSYFAYLGMDYLMMMLKPYRKKNYSWTQLGRILIRSQTSMIYVTHFTLFASFMVLLFSVAQLKEVAKNRTPLEVKQSQMTIWENPYFKSYGKSILNMLCP
jgi:hypothetical protein